MIMRLRNLFVGLLITLASTAAWTQAYPSKPVRIIIPAATGGTPDVFARLIAQRMSQNWGTQVLVENRPGGSGIIAADMVAKAVPDGYTVILTDSAILSINPHLFARLPYDPLKDFAPVMQVGVFPMFVVINASVPASTLQELIAYAREHPGKLSYASLGNGSIHHLTTEFFKSMAKVDIVHVPYKGSGQFAPALLSGEVQMAFSGYTSVAPGINAGRLRLLAVSTAQRLASHPNVPTVSESGVPGFDMSVSSGVVAPAGTPRDVIEKLRAAISAALATPEIVSRVQPLGILISASTPEKFEALIRSEYEKFGQIVKLSGARLE